MGPSPEDSLSTQRISGSPIMADYFLGGTILVSGSKFQVPSSKFQIQSLKFGRFED